MPQTAPLAPAPSRWLPTDAWVRVLLVPCLVFIALATNATYLADFWHHLARGKVIVTQGHLLDHDIYTFTAFGQSFRDINWLSQTIYFLLFDCGGLDLVRVVNALVMALALGLLVLLCYRLCKSRSAAMAIGIGTFLGLWQVLTIRPQSFSLLLFVVLYDVLDRSKRRPWLLFLAPLLMAFWVNLHGAFPAGIMLVGCFFVAEVGSWLLSRWTIRAFPPFPPYSGGEGRGERGQHPSSGRELPHGMPTPLTPDPSPPEYRGRGEDEPPTLCGQTSAGRRTFWLAACLSACVLATLANPYGWQIYQYVGLTSNRAAARGIDEWVPPNLHQGAGIAFFVSLLVLASLIGITWRRRAVAPVSNRLRYLILALCFLPLAAASVRMVAWWLLALAPLAAVLLARLLPASRESENKPSLGAAMTCAALLLVAVFSVPGLQAYNPLLALRPQESTERDLDALLEQVLQHKDAARIFTRFEWGEYLTWAADRRVSVFMDGRIEIYSDKVWTEYQNVTTGREDWAKILDDYQVDALILDSDYHARTGLLARVANSPSWVNVSRSGRAVLYFRR